MGASPRVRQPSVSKVATLGLNPSNREFVDRLGNELVGPARRFHTLSSLGLSRWSEAKTRHYDAVIDYCRRYFARSPYRQWFDQLDNVLSGTGTSYGAGACHLDLVPYATLNKWAKVPTTARRSLLAVGGEPLAMLLRDSSVRLVVLNGASVVREMKQFIKFEEQERSEWSLPRVRGRSYVGRTQSLCGIRFMSEVFVLGFNLNVQSSFGMTNDARIAIRNWIADWWRREGR